MKLCQDSLSSSAPADPLAEVPDSYPIGDYAHLAPQLPALVDTEGDPLRFPSPNSAIPEREVLRKAAGAESLSSDAIATAEIQSSRDSNPLAEASFRISQIGGARPVMPLSPTEPAAPLMGTSTRAPSVPRTLAVRDTVELSHTTRALFALQEASPSDIAALLQQQIAIETESERRRLLEMAMLIPAGLMPHLPFETPRPRPIAPIVEAVSDSSTSLSEERREQRQRELRQDTARRERAAKIAEEVSSNRFSLPPSLRSGDSNLDLETAVLASTAASTVLAMLESQGLTMLIARPTLITELWQSSLANL